MALTNTRIEYGRIAKWLHWGVALLVVGSYVTIYSHLWLLGDSPLGESAKRVHFAIGLSIGALMILRVLWRLTNKTPSLNALKTAHRFGARLSHLALYTVLLLMPTTGYLGSTHDISYFGLFTVPAFIHTSAFASLVQSGVLDKADLASVFSVHQFTGAWVVWALVAVHITAGLYHHWVRRDNTLERMTTGI